ncbi:PROTEIN putative (DUF239)-RELATED-RELATED [Salix koriyanagi]|uniref:PROTEIN putative (DUF239)-RELATED-RELATED n=1 Tax=Salix koriyanagi TaxID=2511006 RepID=A0A9Q1A4A7_9ROSI|nr:PROTEIN putative (DUF239)-RELATED-RELATED [Salix koriyanagi]
MRFVGGKRWFLAPLLLALVFVQGFGTADSSLNYTNYRQVSTMRLERIQRHLDKINKPPVMTIESPDGDIIDCVHKRKQPALDHPLLRNHKIQRGPPERPRVKMLKEDDDHRANKSGAADEGVMRGSWQMWHRNGTRCPRGTIPIRRSQVHDVLRSKSLFDFGKKKASVSLARRKDAPDVVSANGHEHAIAYTGSSQEVYGAKATINVWDPIHPSGQRVQSIPDMVALGIIRRLRSQQHRSWVAGQSGALWVAIGAAISPVSSYTGNQYDISILIWKDPKLGNWWMSFGDNTLVGYWPAELFTHLADHATMVEWGGEVVNSRASGEHTSTQMGSGHFAEDGFGKASYFRNLEIVDSDNSLSSVQSISALAENTNCYNIKSSYNNEWGTHFYYGGPGRNPQCP